MGLGGRTAKGGSRGKSAVGNMFDPGGIFSSVWGEKEEQPTIEELMDRMKAWEREQPEYIKYADELKGMSADNKYGSQQPDWGDILDRTIKKTEQVYHGGPISTGIEDRMRADVAERGMGDSPAMGRQMLQLGAQKSQDIGDISTDIAEQERAMTENARVAWLNRLQSMAGYGTQMPDLSQLFQLDALQQPQQGSGGQGLGGALSGLFGSKQTPTQAIAQSPTSGYGGSAGVGQTYTPMPKVRLAGSYNSSF